jgi:hypothetical protein
MEKKTSELQAGLDAGKTRLQRRKLRPATRSSANSRRACQSFLGQTSRRHSRRSRERISCTNEGHGIEMSLTLARRKPRSVLGWGAADTASLPTLVGGIYETPRTIRQAGSRPRLLPQSRVHVCRNSVSGPCLTRHENARYSSFRRKKSKTESGDIRFGPTYECASFARGTIYRHIPAWFESKPSLALTDSVMLRGAAPRTP